MRKTQQTMKVLHALAQPPMNSRYGAKLAEATGLQLPTVYSILHRFVEEGWATSVTEAGTACELGRPPRRYYSITRTGISNLRPVGTVPDEPIDNPQAQGGEEPQKPPVEEMRELIERLADAASGNRYIAQIAADMDRLCDRIKTPEPELLTAHPPRDVYFVESWDADQWCPASMRREDLCETEEARRKFTVRWPDAICRIVRERLSWAVIPDDRAAPTGDRVHADRR